MASQKLQNAEREVVVSVARRLLCSRQGLQGQGVPGFQLSLTGFAGHFQMPYQLLAQWADEMYYVQMQTEKQLGATVCMYFWCCALHFC